MPNYSQGVCIECNDKPQMSRGYGEYRSVCYSCHRKAYAMKEGGKRYHYRRHKKAHCERCGFIPEHSCQLDVDHKDGDKRNTWPSNLVTLCANCHRLKTHLAGETKPLHMRRLDEVREGN